MDPVSQAVLGAAAAQAVVGERLGRKTLWLGALGGMAPDLDVLIKRSADPLLALEYHRHFTHSLAFIPIGGLLVALPFLALARAREESREHMLLILAATTLGWATHGLLDCFTSYGTLLWWPFSDARVAWNWISVIDPLYTLILAVGVVVAAKTVKRKPVWIALLLSSLYLGLCGVQHWRALAAQAKLAELRRHTIVRGRVQPLFLTNLLWRSLYETPDGRLHVDALSVPWWAKIGHHGGGARPRVEAPEREAEEPRARDLARFAWFTSGWVYAAPELAPKSASAGGGAVRVYCDARYSLEPDRFSPVFCVEIGEQGATQLIQRRPDDAGEAFADMFGMLRPAAPEGADE